MIGATHVNDAIASLHLLQTSVLSRNLWVIEHNSITWQSSNSNDSSSQRNWANLRGDILRCSATIVEGQSHQCAVLITDTEDITTGQRFTKWLVALNMLPLIEQSVECALPGWMG